MYTRSLAADVKRMGVIAFSIDPGWVQTDMGGQSAPLMPAESVNGILRVIDRASRSSNGGYFRYDGATLPW